MSKELLYNLNGNTNGKFKKYLDEFSGEPRIAWYPSAGEDFRALLYLSPNYSNFKKLSTGKLPAPPDLFIFTDYYPWNSSTFLDQKTIYSDGRTTVFLEDLEELPRLKLPLHKEIVSFTEGSIATNRVLFLKIKIESNVLGTIRYPVLYAFVENEAFFCEKLNLLHAQISHIIHVRYGGGCGGGGEARGVWLQCVLKKLKCELFVTDDSNHGWAGGDEKFLKICPDILREDSVPLTPIDWISGESWSNYGTVSLNLCGDVYL